MSARARKVSAITKALSLVLKTVGFLLFATLLAISCSNHTTLSPEEVSSIDVGGWPRGTFIRVAPKTIEDVTHDSFFKYVHITDGEVTRSIVNAVNELTCVPVERELDLRKAILIHLVDGRVITIGLGESSGTLFNGSSIQDSDDLFEIADSILYLSQDKDFWLPDFLK